MVDEERDVEWMIFIKLLYSGMMSAITLFRSKAAQLSPLLE